MDANVAAIKRRWTLGQGTLQETSSLIAAYEWSLSVPPCTPRSGLGGGGLFGLATAPLRHSNIDRTFFEVKLTPIPLDARPSSCRGSTLLARGSGGFLPQSIAQ